VSEVGAGQPWWRVELSVTRLRGDLASPGTEFVRVLVNGRDTGTRCSTTVDCGVPLGMDSEDPLAGDDCAASLDVSSFVVSSTEKAYSFSATAILARITLFLR